MRAARMRDPLMHWHVGNVMVADKKPYIQARIREFLRTAPVLTRILQAARAVLRFGPWRHAARAIIRWRRPPHEGTEARTVVALQLNTRQLTRTLRDDGIAMAGVVPLGMLRRIRAVADDLPPGEYGEFQEIPEVGALALCADVLAVGRGYLRGARAS